jgi:hypothetical protein
MPRFDLRFAAQAQIASEIVVAGEQSRVTRDEWTPKRLEFLYELAYLRVFASWESALESIFYRSLCGYASRAGQEALVAGPYYTTIANAEAAVLVAESRGRVIKTYLLWHSAAQIISRCQTHILAGAPNTPALQETTISSSRARLDALAAVRHRIVHDQADAKTKFDAATLSIAGKTYPASRPGKFLRDIDQNSVPPRKWIDIAIAELTGLAGQMV